MNDLAPDPNPTLDAEDEAALRRLRKVIALFRTREKRIPASYIDAFLLVALEPGRGPTEYAPLLDTSQPVASRLLLELGQHARERATQLDLVDRIPDPRSLARQAYSLTPEGVVLRDEILRTLKEPQ